MRVASLRNVAALVNAALIALLLAAVGCESAESAPAGMAMTPVMAGGGGQTAVMTPPVADPAASGMAGNGGGSTANPNAPSAFGSAASDPAGGGMAGPAGPDDMGPGTGGSQAGAGGMDAAGLGGMGTAAPGDGVPGDGVPADGAPGDGVPGDGAPGDGAPGDGAPGDGVADGPCPPLPEPCKVLPFGDSITEGTPFNDGGYRVQLFTRAVEDGKSITFVGGRSNGPRDVAGQPFPRSHQGTAGITIDGISRNVPSPALDDDPHIILVHIATNDLVWAAPQGVPERLDQLITDLAEGQPNALIMVAQIIPCRGSEAYNAAIPGIVEKHVADGHNVRVVETLADFDGFHTDRIHPSVAGYAEMGNAWYEAIKDLLP